MKQIPKSIRERLSKDTFMENCVACGKKPIEWHHPILYGGSQANFWYTIIPLCLACHRGNNGDIEPQAKYISKLLAIKRGMSSGEIYKDMPKVDWYMEKRNLENKLARLYEGK